MCTLLKRCHYHASDQKNLKEVFVSLLWNTCFSLAMGICQGVTDQSFGLCAGTLAVIFGCCQIVADPYSLDPMLLP